jgi:hypothetical protein
MRKFFTLIILSISLFSANAAPKNTFQGNDGNWNKSSNWSLNRLPKEKDTVVIPSNKTLTLDLSETIALKEMVLRVYGTINMYSWSEITMDASSIFVYMGGRIAKRSYFTSNPDVYQAITIGNINVFDNSNTITGPQMVNAASKAFVSFVEGATPLPVKFVGFYATRKNADVLMQWSTAQEINAKVYEVQRSENGVNWTSIGTVNATGNTSTTTNYSFTDYNANLKIAYYRVKQVDVDNSFEYTGVKTVKAEVTGSSINAIGVRGNVVVQFSEKLRGQVEVRLISLGGQVVSRQVVSQAFGQVVIPATVKGNFIVTVSNENELQLSKQILL